MKEARCINTASRFLTFFALWQRYSFSVNNNGGSLTAEMMAGAVGTITKHRQVAVRGEEKQ